MSKRIPAEAFEQYFALGASRSYEALAERYGVSKRAVSKLAAKENWQKRVMDRERRVQEATEEKAVESLEQMNSRHLRALKIIQMKALDALRQAPIESAMDAVRALDMAIKQERLVRGEPTDRTKLSVEEVIRREYASWLEDEDVGDDEEQEDDEVEEDDAEDQEGGDLS